MSDENDPYWREAECYACEMFAPLDDLGLCGECSAKLDRDMIRERAWAYSMTAFGVAPEKYEELRAAVIAKYGAAMELIAPESPSAKPKRSRRRKRRRKK